MAVAVKKGNTNNDVKEDGKSFSLFEHEREPSFNGANI